jgi:carboxymethylenebutenolidase
VAEAARIPSPGETLMFGEIGAPLVVLVHDTYGRLPWLLEYGGALARVGFRIAVPDLFDGWATVDRGTAADLAARAGDPVDVLRETVVSERSLGSPRAAALGFGWGGAAALRLAQAGSTDAVVAYDATLGDEEHALLPCPVLLQYAERVDWPAGSGPHAFAARLADDGTPVSTHEYVAVQPGFANASVREQFDPNAAALAFARAARFLEDYLLD